MAIARPARIYSKNCQNINYIVFLWPNQSRVQPGLKEVENMLLLAEGTEYCRLRCRIRDLSVTIFENKNMCLG